MDDDNSNIDLGASIEEYYRDLEEDAIKDSADIITDTEYKEMMEKEEKKNVKKKVSIISETETRKQGGKRKEIIEKKTITETVTQTVIIGEDKKEEGKKERKIENGQKDLEGKDAKNIQIIEGEKIIGELCEEIRNYFKENYLIKDINMIDVPYATIVTHMFGGDTVWIACVGQSSGLKSEVMRSAGEEPNDMIYPVSRITANGIMSGTKGDVGLAYDAHNKIIIIKDLVTAIMSRYSEQIFAQLRELYDGYINVTSGLAEGSKTKTKIRVTLIAGVTPDAIEGSTIFKSELGERFIYYTYPKFDMYDISSLTKVIMNRNVDDDKRRKDIGIISKKLLIKIYELKKIYLSQNRDVTIKDEEYIELLLRLAAFVAYLRRSVSWDWKKFGIDTIGTEEGPMRLFGQLMKLSVGLRIVKQKAKVDDEIKSLIMKICTDSIPHRRLLCLQYFLEGYPENKGIRGIELKNRLSLELGFSKSTTRRIIEELVEMNILKKNGYENDEDGDMSILQLREEFVNNHRIILDMLKRETLKLQE